MATPRPITGVGALDASAFGQATVENDAQAVSVPGIAPPGFGPRTLLYDQGVNGAELDFNFTGAYEPPSGQNVGFYFEGVVGETRPVPAAGAGDQLTVPEPILEAGAQVLYPESFQGRLGAPQLYDPGLSGAHLDFAFTGAYSPADPRNTPFYFDDGRIATGLGVGEATQYGTASLETAFSIRPDGLVATAWGTAFTYHPDLGGAHLDFNFAGAYDPRSAANVAFHFSDQPDANRIVPRAGIPGEATLGVPAIENAADAVAPVGNVHTRFSPPLVWDRGRRGGDLDFTFVQEYIQLTGQSVRFDFALEQFVAAVGIKGAIGEPHVENFDKSVFVDGFSGAIYGAPDVAVGGFPQGIEPDGFISAVFGDARVFYPQDVVVSGFDAAQYGAPSFTYDQVLDPTGILPGTVYGEATVQDKADLLQLAEDAGGFKAVRFGGQHIELFNRALPVTGEDAALLGEPHLAFDIQEVKPSGFGGGVAVPEPLVAQYVRYLNQIGATHAAFGETDVAFVDLTKTVPPDGVLGTAFGVTKLELFIRYIYPQGEVSDGDFGRYTDVRNVDREVYPYGLPPGHLGTPHVQEIIDYPIAPLGGDLSSYGTPALENVLGVIAPDSFAGIVSDYAAVYIDEQGFIVTGGIDQARYGDAAYVRLGQFFVELNGDGIDPGGVSGGEISAAQRFIVADQEPLIGTAFGDADLASTIQPPLEVEDIPPIGFGNVFVGYRVRYIEPNAFDRSILGDALLGFAREIAPEGLDATVYGPDTEVLDDTQRLNLPGIPPPGFATNIVTVQFYTRTVGAHTAGDQAQFPRGGLEQHDVRNDWQFIAPYTDTEATWGPFFGTFNYVYNRNRTIGVVGFDAGDVSNAREVRNAAVPLYPVGFAGAIGTAFVADRVRYVAPESAAEFTATSRYTIIYNDARVVGPFGQDQDSYGTPELRNLNRTVKHIFPAEGEAYGTPFVAYAVRDVTFYQGIAPLAFPVPEVFNSDQFITAEGFAPRDATGGHDVNETFNIIAPRYQLQTRYGHPYVFNVTPEVDTYGRDDSRHGEPFVRLQFRTVYAFGNVTTLYGRPNLTRGIRYVGPNGFRGFTSDRFTRVEVADPGLPTPQTIQAQGFPKTADQRDLIGRPHIREARIELSGLDQASYGNPDARSNGIAPKGILLLAGAAFGVPTLYPDRTINLDNQGISGFASPRHRVSPHTIWATFDAPAQARQNHPESDGWEYMDYGGTGDQGRRPFFGRPRVTNENRGIQQNSPHHPIALGHPQIELTQRFIRPDGARPFRYGIPNLLGGDLGLQAYSLRPFLEMGEPIVEYYVAPDVTRTLYVEGLDAFRNGAQRVENFNRFVRAIDYANTEYGEPWVSRSPRFIEHSGKKQTKHGTQWVSLYIRTLHPEGADTSEMNYGLGFFDDRMTVHIDWHVSPGAGDQSAVPVPGVSNHTRGIAQHELPTGSAGHPSLSARSIVALGGYGLAAGAFGDIDRWEAGTVKPHGDAMSRCGPPLISRVINAPGIEGGFGSASIGRGVYPLSINGQAFSEPAITLSNPHGCGQAARAVVPSQFVTHGVGAPTVQ